MTAPADLSQETTNRDINPSQDLVAAYPDLVCLLRNKPVSAAFAAYEKTAVFWKRAYTFLGKLSLVAVLLAMVSFDYQITLKAVYGAPGFLSGLAAAFAAAGLISQALLAATHAKDRWLAARFAAERLRCFKFQLFTLLEEAPDAAALSNLVHRRTAEGLAALKAELQGGRAAILEFSPFDVLPLSGHKGLHSNGQLIERAAALYDTLRFSVESQHFDTYRRAHERETKIPSLLAEFSFMAGAVLACIGILTALLPVDGSLHHLLTSHGVMEWLDFFTWMLFVLSAVIAIHERGSAHQQNAERYVTYGREIRRLRSAAPRHMPASFFESVREMEHLMLREIQDFCRDVKHSNYLF
ncbi:MAG: hypothetical protein JO256_03345 [Alphaproteobacteria bacterium]|nr:hypothetical protein [Alphaproteobacteria bacterium]